MGVYLAAEGVLGEEISDLLAGVEGVAEGQGEGVVRIGELESEGIETGLELEVLGEEGFGAGGLVKGLVVETGIGREEKEEGVEGEQGG